MHSHSQINQHFKKKRKLTDMYEDKIPEDNNKPQKKWHPTTTEEKIILNLISYIRPPDKVVASQQRILEELSRQRTEKDLYDYAKSFGNTGLAFSRELKNDRKNGAALQLARAILALLRLNDQNHNEELALYYLALACTLPVHEKTIAEILHCFKQACDLTKFVENHFDNLFAKEPEILFEHYGELISLLSKTNDPASAYFLREIYRQIETRACQQSFSTLKIS